MAKFVVNKPSIPSIKQKQCFTPTRNNIFNIVGSRPDMQYAVTENRGDMNLQPVDHEYRAVSQCSQCTAM